MAFKYDHDNPIIVRIYPSHPVVFSKISVGYCCFCYHHFTCFDSLYFTCFLVFTVTKNLFIREKICVCSTGKYYNLETFIYCYSIVWIVISYVGCYLDWLSIVGLPQRDGRGAKNYINRKIYKENTYCLNHSCWKTTTGNLQSLFFHSSTPSIFSMLAHLRTNHVHILFGIVSGGRYIKIFWFPIPGFLFERKQKLIFYIKIVCIVFGVRSAWWTEYYVLISFDSSWWKWLCGGL
jgi:hypothetical protein